MKILQNYCDTYTISLPDNKDPAELEIDEFWHRYDNAEKILYTVYI